MREIDTGPKGRGTDRFGSALIMRTGLAAAVALLSLFALTGTASAAVPQIVNTVETPPVSGQSGPVRNWLESFTVSGEAPGPAASHTVRLSLLVRHDRGNVITGIKIDEDYNGTDSTAAATTRTVPVAGRQQPVIIGGYTYTRVFFEYQASSSGTGVSPSTSGCGFTGGGREARAPNRPLRIAAVDNANQVSPSSTSNINFQNSSNCGATFGNNEDYPFLISTSQDATQIDRGQSVTFTYRGDDPDSVGTSNIAFTGLNWRMRRLSDGVTTPVQEYCVGGDNTDRTLTVNFPRRGRWVVEAALLNSNSIIPPASTGCQNNPNPNFFWRLGAVDVNSPATASPEITLGATRPNFNGSTTVTANFNDTEDEPEGGEPEDLEWDRNGDGDFTDTGGVNPDFATLGEWNTGLATGQTTTVNTTGMTPGLKTVCARIGDNGALGGADNIRRTKVGCTEYLVDTPPVANAQTQTVESDATLPLTLTGSDENGDTLSFQVIDPPDHGTLSDDDQASTTYDPDDSFAGTDTFTFRVGDGFDAFATAVVTIRVTPATNITSAPSTPNDPMNSREAVIGFGSPVAGVTFECRLDDGNFEPCTDPRTYQDLSDGNHDVAVRAILDGAGGPYMDPTPAETSFQIDAFPILTITSEPDSQSSATSATIEFTATEAGSNDPITTTCSLDNGPRRPCESPATFTDLSSGTHTITVYAVDSRGKEVSETREFEIDADAPLTTITDSPPATGTSSEASFSFESSEPNSTFECALDSTVFASCTSPQPYSNLDDGDHTFFVRAIDQFGTTDPTPASHTFNIDTSAPATTVSNGPSGPTRTPPQYTFDSDQPESMFECSIDSGNFEACTSPFTIPGTLSDGPHTLDVRAIDPAGNPDPSPETRNFTLDRVDPTTQIDNGPQEGSTVSASAVTFDFSSPDGGSTFECSEDGAAYVPCSSGEQMTGLDNGQHSFAVRSRDAAGNTGDPATRNFAIDRIAPQTRIDSGPAGTVRTQNVSFGFSSPDSDATDFLCSLDNALFQACTSPKSYTGLSGGQHSFRVVAADDAGNTDQSPAQRSFTVDTSAQPPPNEPPDDPDPPVEEECTFGKDLADCGAPALISKLRLFRDDETNVYLHADGGGATLIRATFKLPKAVRVTTGGADAGNAFGLVVFKGSSRKALRLVNPRARKGRRLLASSGATRVFLNGRVIKVVTPKSAGAKTIALRLIGRGHGVLTTKARCRTLRFSALLTDDTNKQRTPRSRSDLPCNPEVDR